MVLNEVEIRQKLANLSDWMTNGNHLTRVFEFKNFPEAIDFVNRLVAPAEGANHHPDISIAYNRVTIHLTTHDEGGITQKDFDLAHSIQALY